MAYIDLITLAEAKNFLRIDDTLTEDDNYITRLISSAFSWIEKRTNVMVYARDKNFDVTDGEARIYDYPINTDLSTVAGYTFHKKGLYYLVCADDTETTEITLNVGEVYPTKVSQELIEVAYEIIDFYYYKAKDEKNKGKTLEESLSPMSMEFINVNRRFIL